VSPPPPLDDKKTALDREIENPEKRQRIEHVLFLIAGRRGLQGDAAMDVVDDAYTIAFEHERKGDCWDPAVEEASVRIARFLQTVLRTRRRDIKRKPPPVPLDAQGSDPPSDLPPADELLAEAQEEARRAARAERLLERLAAEPSGKLYLSIVHLAREGVSKSKDLAAKLGCTPKEVRAARIRIGYHAQRIMDLEAS
jgi:hypothetical protein